MGHYLSEMESPAEADARNARADRITSLRERGYRFVAGGSSVRSHEGGELLHHTPCGGAVFDPDIHDGLCLAKAKKKK